MLLVLFLEVVDTVFSDMSGGPALSTSEDLVVHRCLFAKIKDSGFRPTGNNATITETCFMDCTSDADAAFTMQTKNAKISMVGIIGCYSTNARIYLLKTGTNVLSNINETGNGAGYEYPGFYSVASNVEYKFSVHDNCYTKDPSSYGGMVTYGGDTLISHTIQRNNTYCAMHCVGYNPGTITISNCSYVDNNFGTKMFFYYKATESNVISISDSVYTCPDTYINANRVNRCHSIDPENYRTEMFPVKNCFKKSDEFTNLNLPHATGLLLMFTVLLSQ